MGEKQDDDDDQEYPDEAVAPVAVAVTKAAKAPAEAALIDRGIYLNRQKA